MQWHICRFEIKDVPSKYGGWLLTYYISTPWKAEKGWPSSLGYECWCVKCLSEFSRAVEEKPTEMTSIHNMTFSNACLEIH